MANGVPGAAAYQRLQPKPPIKIGAIIEEQVRYWKKYDDAKDAAEKARRAKAAELAGKQDKEFFKLYSGLTPEENQGFLNTQIIDAFEKKKPMLADLAKKASRGDIDARLKLQDWKGKFDNLVKANKVYGEKMQNLQAQKAEGNYNEFLDKPIEDFGMALSKGMYKLDQNDLSLDMYDPTSGEVKKVPASTLLSNEFLESSYHKPPQFQTNGATIAKGLLDTADGQKLIDSQTKTKGVRLVKNLFAQDPTEGLSWYGSYMRELGVDPMQQKPFSQLSELEKNLIAESYYDKNVLPRIQEVTKDTTLDDANKRAALEGKRLNNKRKRQQIRKANRQDTSNIITIETNEKGEILQGLQARYPTTAFGNEDEVYVIGNNGVSLDDVKGNKSTRTTLTELVEDPDGNVIGLAKKTIRTPVLDEDGEPTGRFETEVVDEVITNKNQLNKFSRLIEKESGKKHKNLTEVVGSMRKARAEIEPPVETTRQIVTPEQKQQEQQRPMTVTPETREGRIARMRAAIQGR